METSLLARYGHKVDSCPEEKSPPENHQIILSGDIPVSATASDSIEKIPNDREGITEKIGLNPEVNKGDGSDMGNTSTVNNKSEPSIFGPWMLVRRSSWFKGKGFAAIKENKQGLMNGSRFSSLIEETGMEIEDTTQSRGLLEDTVNNINKEEGFGPTSKKIKVRNPLAGKNPQNRPKQLPKGPSSSQKQISVTTKAKVSNDKKKDPTEAKDEPPRHNNKMDSAILHRMRVLQK
ncbi:hypothetical protein RIF29_21045 [Crotalaria pallida]|uniref:Uncharacterized protein n=1 Tax=Crotalaria pallida TaxID=3830 RepID=A0AAN9F2E9_CROPI